MGRPKSWNALNQLGRHSFSFVSWHGRTKSLGMPFAKQYISCMQAVHIIGKGVPKFRRSHFSRSFASLVTAKKMHGASHSIRLKPLGATRNHIPQSYWMWIPWILSKYVSIVSELLQWVAPFLAIFRELNRIQASSFLGLTPAFAIVFCNCLQEFGDPRIPLPELATSLEEILHEEW